MINKIKIIKVAFYLVFITMYIIPSVAQTNDFQARDTTKTGTDTIPEINRNFDPPPVALLPPQYTLPSPVSQVFQRFRGSPPDFSTGAVSIPIPLYSFETNGFSIPLSLNYQTSGIKVESGEYPLGYGWALHPGLRITRTVLGWPDDKFRLKNIKNDAYPYSMAYGWEPFYYIRSLINKQYRYEEDSQYDIFTLSLPDRTISFLLKFNAITYIWEAIVADSPVKIKVLNGSDNFAEFLVTDEQGVKYYFGGSSVKLILI